MTRLGLLALLGALLLAAPVGGRPPEPDAEEGIRILEADEPRLADRIRIGGPPARWGRAPTPAAAASRRLLPSPELGADPCEPATTL